MGTISWVVSNQNTDIWVSTLPLSGIGVGRTTSYAEIRSDATISRSSSSSYISRTLPLACSFSSASAALIGTTLTTRAARADRLATAMAEIAEIVPGLLHWSGPHPRIGQVVHSHYVVDSGTVLDPILPDGALDELVRLGPPQRVVLTNRHHYRDSGTLAAELGIPVLCPEPGLHEFEGGSRQVQGYAYGDRVVPGITAHEIGWICPDDAALHIEAGPGAVALADAVIRWDGRLSFVPDFLMDDPDDTKRGILESLRAVCEVEFDALALAHGEPAASGGRAELEAFMEQPRSASF